MLQESAIQSWNQWLMGLQVELKILSLVVCCVGPKSAEGPFLLRALAAGWKEPFVIL